jgi:hypothetical protein
MCLVLNDPDIPEDTGVGIEYQIPQTSKRIDVLLSGRSAEDRDGAVIIELKQWETADPTEMDGIVRTVLGGAPRDTLHPSYQAWSYAELLRGFNESIYEGDIALHPCAFLHNYAGPGALHADFYQAWLAQAPLFAKGEVDRLRAFIKKWIRYGDRSEIIFRIDRGKIRRLSSCFAPPAISPKPTSRRVVGGLRAYPRAPARPDTFATTRSNSSIM